MGSMRMVAALLLMQSRGRITAAELAEELEVSVATARRDLAALSAAGVPVYPQPGRRGGWQLVGGARTDLTGLTAAEAQELFVLLGTSQQLPGPASTAVRKLLRALPVPFRDDAEAAIAAVRADAAGWGSQEHVRPPIVDRLQRAVIDRCKIIIDYTGRDRARGQRVVGPLGLIDKGGQWYLIAVPDGREDSRTYRVDRIGELTITDDHFERPEGFDLSRSWQRIAEQVEAERGRVRATVLVERRRLSALREHFGRYLDVLGDHRTDEDHDQRCTAERVRVTVAAQSVRAIAEQLAGWGQVVEVLGPDSVRRELVAIGRDLIERYR
jgi:predicted DNA-binding transcriptional regulator YafY